MSHGGSEEVTDTGVEATSYGRARGRERGAMTGGQGMWGQAHGRAMSPLAYLFCDLDV
jgi:hypothetical protein